ncbi:cytochrome P450 [Piptocephalis cylindrospora]|uniref:Cytochrome P450 n=1 Tax=Piptocephalis cylindrospora TaxID=1907219 RepID=A0A4V1IYG8_9FUNG|nr:cytochrome P450 [Piptocephalis cylindrospora]|eukprot:RKP14509.1 cytochrome P450 [Piptocephalis cylindrospora]
MIYLPWQPIASAGLAWFIYKIYKARTPERPGPPGIPFLGNLLEIGPLPHIPFTKWAQKYGDVFFLKMGPLEWMIINSPEALHEVLSRRGATFASRPHQTMLSDVASEGRDGIVGLSYGPVWKMARRVFTTVFSKSSVQAYEPILTHEARSLCRALIEDNRVHGSKGFSTRFHHQWHSFNVIISVCFGFRVNSYTDSLCQLQLKINHQLFQALDPKYYLADFLPFLRPFSMKKKREMKKVMDNTLDFSKRLYDRYKENKERIDAKIPTNMCKYIQELQDAGELRERNVYLLLGETFAAGLDTASTSLTWLSLILATRPDVQKKAHDELDRIVGRNRLPTQEDIDSLPYIRCILQESVRVRGPSPLGLTRTCLEDSEYRGMLVRKGTWIIPNVHATHSVYSHLDDPTSFVPERWESNPKSLVEETMGKQGTREIWTFGGGRRVCPGLHLANASLIQALTHILWSFTLVPGDGVNIDLDEMEEGLTNLPLEQMVRYIPRGEHVEPLLSADRQVSLADTLSNE